MFSVPFERVGSQLPDLSVAPTRTRLLFPSLPIQALSRPKLAVNVADVAHYVKRLYGIITYVPARELRVYHYEGSLPLADQLSAD